MVKLTGFSNHIPQLRNKYSHGALDGGEKEELNSFDLLLDIKFLLKVFIELESPYINLTNMISKHDYQLSSIDDIAIIFELINSLKPEHKKELKSRLDNFFNVQLIENKHLEYIIYGVKEDLKTKLDSLTDAFNKIFTGKINLVNNNYKEIQDYFKNQNNVEIFRDEIRLYETNFQNIRSYDVFYKNFNKKFPKVDSELKTLIENTFKPDMQTINKISFLSTIID